MADIKGTPEPNTRHEFPEVKGKIVDGVEIVVEPDYYGIDIRFQDKTGLAFSIEHGVVTFPSFADWTGGKETSIKRYGPVRSKGFRS